MVCNKELTILIRKEMGSRTLYDIFCYMEENFKKSPGGFFKFIAPAKSSEYSIGKSVSEENLVDRKTANRCLKRICVLYRSPEIYKRAIGVLGEEGAFQGMPYLRYINHYSHQTFFMRNAKIAEGILKGIPLKKLDDGEIFYFLREKKVLTKE